MNTLLVFAVVQAFNLVVFAWFNRVALVRIWVLRQQLGVHKRKKNKPKLRNRDRLLWSLLSKIWEDWSSELILLRSETVIRWRKRKFRDFWRNKSQRKTGRPAIPRERIEFIRRISSDHPEYGEDRIALELEMKFAVRHASSTVRRYMVKRCPPSDSQAWNNSLKNQAKAMWTCDFFVQHTIGFHVLYVFIIMELSSRKLIHFNVTEHPTLEWTKQQVQERLLRGIAQVPAPRQRREVRPTRSSARSGQSWQDDYMSIHIRYVAVAGNGHPGDCHPVWCP